MTPELILAPEYECHPLWIRDERGTRNVAPRELPISDELAREIDRWAQAYESTYEKSDPALSGFRSEKRAHEFDVTGRELLGRLMVELGLQYRYRYFSVQRGWIDLDGSD